jgi:hypothetical protein
MKSQDHCQSYSDNTGTRSHQQNWTSNYYTKNLYHEVCSYLEEEEEAQRNLYDEVDILFSRGRNTLRD